MGAINYSGWALDYQSMSCVDTGAFVSDLETRVENEMRRRGHEPEGKSADFLRGKPKAQGPVWVITMLGWTPAASDLSRSISDICDEIEEGLT